MEEAEEVTEYEYENDYPQYDEEPEDSLKTLFSLHFDYLISVINFNCDTCGQYQNSMELIRK